MKNLLKSFVLCFTAACLLACGPHHGCMPSPSKCGTGKTIIVKVGDAICGYGVWGNLWLQAKDSLNAQPLTWLQPYSLEKGVNYSPKAGEFLKISYVEAKADNRYANTITCAAYPGQSSPIHILCIQPASGIDTITNIVTKVITNTQITKTLKVFMSCSGTGVFGEKWFYDESTNTYLQPCKWIGNATLPIFEQINNTDLYEVTYAPSSSTECQDNYNEHKWCFAGPPTATPIDIWTMKKVK